MWLVITAQAFGQQPLGFEEALREAVDRAPTVDVAEATELARLVELQSDYALLDNPALEAERIGDETELRVGLPIPIAGQPIARASAAAAGRDAAQLSAQVGRADAILAVGVSWLDTRRALDRDLLKQGALDLARSSREGARKLLETGEMGTVEAAVAEATAVRAEVDASLARQEVVREALLLEARLGRTPTGAVVPADWPELEPPPTMAPGSLPTVLAATREADRARSAATLAAQDLVPTPTLTGGWQAAGDASRPIYGVSVSLPIFAPGLGDLRRARGERDRAHAEATRTRLEAEAAWTAAVRELESAEAAWAASHVEGLDRALDDLATAWSAGEYSLIHYVAQRDAVIAGLEAQIDARYRRAIANLRLWGLAGEIPVGETP